jgi:hypothetical protein
MQNHKAIEQPERNRRQHLFADMEPFSVGEVYVNSLDEGEGHRVREAYGINYARLVTSRCRLPSIWYRFGIVCIAVHRRRRRPHTPAASASLRHARAVQTPSRKQ